MPDPLFRQRLREPYRPTYLPDGRKAYNPSRTMLDIYDEWAALEAKVRAEEPDCPFPDLRARNLWQKEEARAEKFRGWQDRDWKPRMKALCLARFDANESERRLGFTKEEIERLVEHFAGANDPVAQSILAKALAGLDND